MKPLIDKNEFINLDKFTWLYCGAEAPIHRGVSKAITEYIENKSYGPSGRENHSNIENNCKENLATLLGGKQEEIALMSNASEIISTIALSLNLNKGDNVVINNLEFPSGILPWLSLKRKGVEVRVVEHKNWEIEIESILDEVDENTKLVMTSHVSYLSGARIDYEKLYNELLKTDALLFLDATQSLGVIPVNMYKTDFVVCSSYKWLLSIHGIGILGINPNRASNITPWSVGWRSIPNIHTSDQYSEFSERFIFFSVWNDARKFELGMPSYATIYALNYSSKMLLNIGIDEIENHVINLGEYLINGLKELKYNVITPSNPIKRAGNVTILTDEYEWLRNKLQDENILVWGGDGRIRISIHLFNDNRDIKKLLDNIS